VLTLRILTCTKRRCAVRVNGGSCGSESLVCDEAFWKSLQLPQTDVMLLFRTSYRSSVPAIFVEGSVLRATCGPCYGEDQEPNSHRSRSPHTYDFTHRSIYRPNRRLAREPPHKHHDDRIEDAASDCWFCGSAGCTLGLCIVGLRHEAVSMNAIVLLTSVCTSSNAWRAVKCR
jgi:hypothetical protein